MKAMFVRSVVVVVGMAEGLLSQATWTQVIPVTAPSARHGHAMAYDSVRQRTVLFGGFGGGVTVASETWEWDGAIWLLRTPSTIPPHRSGHAMVYDSARQRVFLFGGSGFSLLGDTWEWDGANWQQSTSSPVSPAARWGHAMVYDSARQRVVMFGGRSISGDVADTWEWDGGNWIQLSPIASPTPRRLHAMAYDSVRQRTVLFGGTTGQGETWEWNGSYWAAVFAPAFPPARFDHAMAYDAARQRIVLFGGSSYGAPLGDSWGFNGASWVSLMPTGSPPSRYGHEMVYEAAYQRLVLFGGTPGFMDDTWHSGVPGLIATATTFGLGCGQPSLGILPDAGGRPVLGQVATATVVNAPTPAVFVALGASNQSYGPFSLPVTLAGIGMIGCDLYQSADVLGVETSPISPATRAFALAVPSAQSLVGLHIYMQAYAFAPGANPLNVIVSNAIDWLLGNV